jgi:hypothetical protein
MFYEMKTKNIKKRFTYKKKKNSTSFRVYFFVDSNLEPFKFYLLCIEQINISALQRNLSNPSIKKSKNLKIVKFPAKIPKKTVKIQILQRESPAQIKITIKTVC